MKVLIIGAAGFVGTYLIQELKKADDEIYVTKMPQEKIQTDGILQYNLDILQLQQMEHY